MFKIISWIKSLFKKEEKPMVDDKKDGHLLWYPKAVIPEKRMKTEGKYAKGYPVGAVIHATAGRDSTEREALDSYNWGVDSGYTFFVIGPTGVVYQGFPLNEWGSHAGRSSWAPLDITGVSRHLVGIEVACANQLDSNYKSWFGVTYKKEDCRKTGSEHGTPGIYKKFTQAQEDSLVELLVWLKKNNPETFKNEFVLSHFEVSPGRKVDPSGSLSMTMPELRQLLNEKN